jgi:phenylalanyl-tRNA synthetase beta chain
MGCNELKTYNFTDIKTLQKSNQEVDLAYKVINSLAPELELMRTSITPSLLNKAVENLQKSINEFALYEFNIAHHKDVLDDQAIPAESWYLSLIYTSKDSQIDGSPYYQAKRYLEKALGDIKIKNLRYELVADTPESDLDVWVKNLISLYERNRSAFVYVNEKILGIVGELDIEVINNFKLPKFSCGFEININTLSEVKIKNKQYREIPKYPPVMKDLCFELNTDTKYEEVRLLIKKAINNNDLWGEVEGLDIYQKDENDSTKRITYRITVRNYNKTLSDKDIESILKKIEKNISNNFDSRIV